MEWIRQCAPSGVRDPRAAAEASLILTSESSTQVIRESVMALRVSLPTLPMRSGYRGREGKGEGDE